MIAVNLSDVWRGERQLRDPAPDTCHRGPSCAERLPSCSRFAQNQVQQTREAVLNLVTPKAVTFEVPIVSLPNQPSLE